MTMSLLEAVVLVGVAEGHYGCIAMASERLKVGGGVVGSGIEVDPRQLILFGVSLFKGGVSGLGGIGKFWPVG